MHSSRQTKDFLLCKECDNSLNKNGENWIIPLLARQDGRFPLIDLLQKLPPDAEREELKVYCVAKNSCIDVPKLTHFALGVFWKASVHSWKRGKVAPMIELGPYADKVRDFLLGRGSFPANMSLSVWVSPKDRMLVTIGQPYRSSAKGFRSFVFYVPGIQFVLCAGKQIGALQKQFCFFAHPCHPIVVCDTSKGFLKIVTEMSRTAHKSKRFVDAVSKGLDSPKLVNSQVHDL
jgi:hypothetical protein